MLIRLAFIALAALTTTLVRGVDPAVAPAGTSAATVVDATAAPEQGVRSLAYDLQANPGGVAYAAEGSTL